MKRILIWLVVLVVCPGLLTGCNTLSTWFDEDVYPVQKQVKLTWMHYLSEEGAIRWIDAATDVFALTHDGVVFDIKAVNSSDYSQLLRKKLASGDMPDIFMADYMEGLKEFIDAGYVADLTEQDFFKNNLKDGSAAGTMLYGKIWCVPIETTALGVTYNKDVFKKAGIFQPPKTHSEFLAVCEAIRQIGITPIGAPYADTLTIRSDFNCDMVQSALKYNPDWLVEIEEGKATWAADRARFKAALTRFGQRSAYINADCFDTDWNRVTAMLADGNIGMVLNGTWTIDAVRSKSGMTNLGFFAFPWSDDPSEVKLPMKTTGGIAVNGKSPNSGMAIQVLKFFTHQEVGKVFQNFKRSISTVKGLDMLFDPAFKDIETYMNSKAAIDYSTYFPDFREEDLNKLLDDVLVKFLLDGGQDADKYVRILDEEVAKLIKAR